MIIRAFLIFIVLDLIENIVHFNIGRNSSIDNFQFSLPSIRDFIKMIIVILIFGIVEGGFKLYD
jgi:hypothetical protein